MSKQTQDAFENFLSPIATEIKERGLKIAGILSDKQRGLVPAVKTQIKGIAHGDSNAHYLKNLAEPVANADEEMKLKLRQKVREEVGELIRQENENGHSGVLTVTGGMKSPIESEDTKQKVEKQLEIKREDHQDKQIVVRPGRKASDSQADNSPPTEADNRDDVVVGIESERLKARNCEST